MAFYKNNENEFYLSENMSARGRGLLPLCTFVSKFKHLYNQWSEMKTIW